MPKNKSEVDICVLTAGRFDLLHQCLLAIEAEMSDTPCNLYIFDNGSPSDELQLFRSLFTGTHITKSKRIGNNRGYPYGANAAIRMGQAPYVLFVSDDVVLQKGALQSLLKTMKENNKIAMCGLKLLFPKYSTDQDRPAGKVQHVGHTIDLRGRIVHPFLGWSADNPRTCVSREVTSITGAAFMTTRKAFNVIGGFSEAYGKGYMEDVEMCLRLHSKGYTIWLDANAIAEHYVGATFEKIGEGSPLEQNKRIFFDRNQQLIAWTDYIVR